MQGAAFGGHPKQATPQRVVDAGQRSKLALAARENFSVFSESAETIASFSGHKKTWLCQVY